MREAVNVGAWLADRAAERPQHAALVVDATGESWSYAELDATANRAASALAELGVREGERLALALRSEPLYLALYFAAARLGAICVPLNTRLTAHELAFQIGDCRPAAVVRDASIDTGPVDAGATRVLERDAFLARLPERAGPPEPLHGGERPQVLMYTSGTTGRPKGAVLPHRKTLYNTLNAVEYLGLVAEDVVLAPVPLFHSFGLKILAVPALYVGATLVLVDRFDARGLQRSVTAHGATLLGGVPVMFRRMREAGIDPGLRRLRTAFCAGAPLDVETIRAFGEAGVRIQQGYGQTETSILCCLDAAHALSRAGSVGRPVRHGEVRIGDEAGRELPRGAAGEVLVRGPIVMLGYWERPEETAQAQVDGWHRTGDLGVMDRDDFVTLVGRRRELFISGGENVYPAEVERALEQHPDVVEAAVVGVPDDRWGEAGRAYVVSRTPLDAEALLEWARERLARYKIPREVVAVEELPRTASGKVRKHVLVAGEDRS